MIQGRYESDPGLIEERGLSPLGFDPSHALEAVTNFAKKSPHVALTGALAVGFVLGGGLTPRLVGAIAMFAARRYFQSAVEEALAAVQSTLEEHTHHDA